ncbi:MULTISPECIES: mannosyl-3-phosphoglycerate phosphatase-related protein [unclassified Escherichia]|uniref:mannosyl-3-phosphoglycerate phosphatase-related protein n=1 Tax=unclassified Escherichia TaxID=2608889 RepID=UPI00102A023D|nr:MULTISPECIES: mannosyl-3-phosphoglycerate phosphatase-related protein [unclassified Escherichia]RZM96040.1 mannosyl-3-phosphoglycerate phosphatase-related protein [Escherichia sp. E14V5]RZN01598.1 mannosyl-3-phosphoglycerate phosphatase-related protein [Escherichia sp. E14V7]RZN25486.1 mannosyl-3-phosphoglycerate phosphatase-related protein [Escherichia sp. E14V10]TGB61311.1 mannosyl-3-phosphoglycerate phosphatase-related protein [Escherichia sp. E5028]TGB99571.1 mannosyl-3-phosphoglycerate
MLSIHQPLLIFTDLDGTLLDSHSYDWQPAASWLIRLREAEIPVILCSSKTSAEMLYLQKMLGLQGLSLIAENGAVIQLDQQWQDLAGFPRIISGIAHSEISLVLNTLREKEHFKFTTFDDVDDTTIAEWTGLSRSQAALTQLHEASVTLIWRDSDERMAQFTARLNELGLQFVQGARFWHVLDVSAGKDQAANWIIAAYQQSRGKRPTTLGLGDGPNDAPLLEVMDYAVIVKGLNREGVHLQNEDPARVLRTQREGPEGWREGLDHFFTAS